MGRQLKRPLKSTQRLQFVIGASCTVYTWQQELRATVVLTFNLGQVNNWGHVANQTTVTAEAATPTTTTWLMGR